MDQNLVSILDTSSSGDRRLRDLIEQNHVMGVVTILMGLSQVGLSLSFTRLGPLLTKSSVTGFVLAASGWLLIGIGLNVFQGRKAFDGGWNSERVTWLWMVLALILTVGVAAATVWVVFS